MFATIPALIPLSEEGGPFDTVLGLPVHPLVVHAAVVLVPLGALGVIAIAIVPRWRRAWGWLVMVCLAVAAGSAFVAKESGEALAERLGEPERHAELGELMPIMALGLLVAGVAWYLVARQEDAASRAPGVLTRILAVVAVGVAVLNLVWVVLVGHSGAQAVWSTQISATPSAASIARAPI